MSTRLPCGHHYCFGIMQALDWLGRHFRCGRSWLRVIAGSNPRPAPHRDSARQAAVIASLSELLITAELQLVPQDQECVDASS
jgi:hypothetical protein